MHVTYFTVLHLCVNWSFLPHLTRSHSLSLSFERELEEKEKKKKRRRGWNFRCIGVKFRKRGNGSSIQYRVQLVHCTLPLKDFLKGRVLLISMGSELSSSHPRGMYRGEFFWCTFQWGRKCGNVAAQETNRGTPVWDPITFMGGSC